MSALTVKGFSPELLSLLFVALKSLLQKIRLTGILCSCTTENFGSQGCSPSRKENFSAHQRFALQVRPPERKFFPLTGGRGSCRAVISASRQVGMSAEKFRLTRMFAFKRFAHQKSFNSLWLRPILPPFVATKAAPTESLVPNMPLCVPQPFKP